MKKFAQFVAKKAAHAIQQIFLPKLCLSFQYEVNGIGPDNPLLAYESSGPYGTTEFGIGLTFGYPNPPSSLFNTEPPEIHLVKFDYVQIKFSKEPTTLQPVQATPKSFGAPGWNIPLNLMPWLDYEFWTIRDRSPRFEFSLLFFDALRLVCSYSKYVYISGAYIRPGKKYLPSPGFEDKEYFTLKIEGDMEMSAIEQIKKSAICVDKIREGEFSFVTTLEKISSSTSSSGSESFLGDGIIPPPCPPWWETFNNLLPKINGKLSDLDCIIPPSPEEPKPLVRLSEKGRSGTECASIPLQDYLELVKVAYVEFVQSYATTP